MDLQFIEVSKKYLSAAPPAVQDLCLTIEDGSFVVLLGPSGSGKSTILNLAAGLEKPDAGEIRGDGRLLNDLEPRERNVAMVFQSYALYPHMSVFENIAFPLSVRKVSKTEQNRLVGAAAESLRMTHLLERRIQQLSGGEAQRVALARAMVREPSIFLMDEPLSNLDAKLRIEMRAEMQRLHRRLETTILYVTHDQEEAMAIGDSVAVMHNGRLQQFSTPSEIFDNPANTFVAGFIGTPEINLLRGRLEETSGELVFSGQGVRFVLPPMLRDSAKSVQSASDFLIGVRPEDIAISSIRSSVANPGMVDVVERVGRDVHVHVNVDSHVLRVIAKADADLHSGQEVWLSFEHGKVHLFNGDTGHRLGSSG